MGGKKRGGEREEPGEVIGKKRENMNSGDFELIKKF